MNNTGKQVVLYTGGVKMILGLWLIIAPFFLRYSDITSAFWNDIIVGVLVVIFAGVRIFEAIRQTVLSWINTVLGVWLILAPFMLGYANNMKLLWNDIILGLIIAFISLIGASIGSPATHTER